MSDSLMLVRVDGNILDSIRAGGVRAGRMTFSSDYPLLDFLYRLEASSPSQERYAPQTPYEIFLDPLGNESAWQLLESRLKHGLVVPYESRSAGWPAINANAEWLLAATELDAARGEHAIHRAVAASARQMLGYDRKINFNPSTGLFTGIPRYMNQQGIFPSWMTQTDLASASSLTVNAAYAASMKRLDLQSDSLTKALKKELWIPNMGYLSALSYGIPVYQTQLQATDNLGQAIAVISGCLSDAMADAIVRKTPVTPMGATMYHPPLTSSPTPVITKEGISPRLVQAAWTIAAARAGNEAAYSSAVGSLIALEGRRLQGYRHQLPTFRSAMSVLILRGFLGASFAPEGIFFTPYVPETLPGEKTLGNLRYRDSRLDIRISGTGRVISSFTIDGKPSEPFFPATLTGNHTIQITLAGATADPGFVNIYQEDISVPLPPDVSWIAPRQAKLSRQTSPTAEDEAATGRRWRQDESGCYLVYLDGILQEEIFRDEYTLYEATEPVAVQFTTFADSRRSGFSSSPYLYIPPGALHLVNAPDIARSGSKILEDKKLASRFVESNRFKNRNIPFTFDAPAAGNYLVEVHYADGMGVVNNQRKLALRRLRVNGDERGTFIFPQRSPSDAKTSAGEPWQEMTAWSNMLPVSLKQGENRLELRYYQPSPVYTDPNSNTILFDMIRIIPVNPR